jgi:hypothetical protein
MIFARRLGRLTGFRRAGWAGLSRRGGVCRYRRAIAVSDDGVVSSQGSFASHSL